MKKNFQKLQLGISLALLLLLASCAPDTEGPLPTDDRDKYVGTWSCAENSSQTGASTFDVTLRKNVNDQNQLIMDNFYHLGTAYAAYITKSGNSLSINTQSVSGNTVQGSGSIATDTKINLSYTVNDGSGAGGIDNCTAIFTKR